MFECTLIEAIKRGSPIKQSSVILCRLCTASIADVCVRDKAALQGDSKSQALYGLTLTWMFHSLSCLVALPILLISHQPSRLGQKFEQKNQPNPGLRLAVLPCTSV